VAVNGGARLFEFGGGKQFVGYERHVPAVPPYGHLGSDDTALASWVQQKWQMAFEAKRGETARLKLCELFWAGFHYENAWDHKHNPVTNFCFSTVETPWSILTGTRPRPEPVARRSLAPGRLDRIRGWATYKMDTCGFDRIFRLSVRDLLKFGWSPTMIGWDGRGNAVPRHLSPFDFYPDPGAVDESTMEFFIIALPVPVAKLRALYPQAAADIQPDNVASPSYEVFIRPYIDYYEAGMRYGHPQIVSPGLVAVKEGDTATQAAHWVADTGSYMQFGQSAMLVQLFCRDYTTMPVKYVGDWTEQSDAGPVSYGGIHTTQEPCCESGWRMIPMLNNGKVLGPPMPVDVCLGGVPLVIGRDYEQGGRFYAKGELDDVIPLQRAVNRQDALISRDLELTGNPPIKVTGVRGVLQDRSGVDGGEIIRVPQGTVMEYLQKQGVAEAHFQMRSTRRMDMQIISGQPDALLGQRPTGIEAAAAIRRLQEGAAARANAKGPALLEFGALLLKKMMCADAMKSEDALYYQGEDGTDAWINPEDLDPEDFDIRWAEGSGTAQGRQDRRDLDMQLYQMGVIDGSALLEDLDYPDRGAVQQRVTMARMQQAQAAAASAKGAGGSRNGGAR